MSVRGHDVGGWAREADWTAWMRAAMSGDAGAYRQFLVSVTPHLRAMARYRCRVTGASEGDAEDIVQEALLAIHLKRGTWDQSRPIGPWIAAIVHNKLVDSLRRRGRHVTVPIEDVIETLGAEDHADNATPGEIDGLLGQLKLRQREIVKSISINGSSVRETADRLHMTEGAVRVALHRALKTLAALYRGQTA
jgi:RNA polymerase sigma factor (sigma-70 family)